MAWKNVWRNKIRTFLTIIAVAIGTSSVILLVSLATGLKANAEAEIQREGTLMEINIYGKMSREFSPLNRQDLITLKRMANVKAVLADKSIHQQPEILMGAYAPLARVMGINVEEHKKVEQKMERGEFFRDPSGGAVVSYGFLKNIFPKSGRTDVQPRAKKIDPVNKTVLLTFHKKTAEGGILNKSVRLKINGVLSPPSNPWQMDDSVIYIPMEVIDDVTDWTGNPHGEAETMAVEIVGGDRMYMDHHEMVWEFDNINVHVDNVNNIEKVIKELDEQQYAFWSIYQNLKQIKLVFLIIQIVLGCIGAIALVVASIGIANVMIMSIMERTREIGIMKVVGANAPTVRRLFLLESGYIGLLGGALGGIVSIVFSALANLIFGVIFSQALAEMDTFSRISIIPFWLLAFGIVFSFMVGILAGIYPANRAVNLSSIEAIRQD